MSDKDYTLIAAEEVPRGLRWDVPRRHQGLIVEVAYATPGADYLQDEGAMFMRTRDLSEGNDAPSRYWKLEDLPS